MLSNGHRKHDHIVVERSNLQVSSYSAAFRIVELDTGASQTEPSTDVRGGKHLTLSAEDALAEVLTFEEEDLLLVPAPQPAAAVHILSRQADEELESESDDGFRDLRPDWLEVSRGRRSTSASTVRLAEPIPYSMLTAMSFLAHESSDSSGSERNSSDSLESERDFDFTACDKFPEDRLGGSELPVEVLSMLPRYFLSPFLLGRSRNVMQTSTQSHRRFCVVCRTGHLSGKF